MHWNVLEISRTKYPFKLSHLYLEDYSNQPTLCELLERDAAVAVPAAGVEPVEQRLALRQRRRCSLQTGFQDHLLRAAQWWTWSHLKCIIALVIHLDVLKREFYRDCFRLKCNFKYITFLPSVCSKVRSSPWSSSPLWDATFPVHPEASVGKSSSSSHRSPCSLFRCSTQIWKPCISSDVLRWPANIRSTLICLDSGNEQKLKKAFTLTGLERNGKYECPT